MGLRRDWYQGDKLDLAAIEARVRKLKNHPALLCWTLWDEPNFDPVFSAPRLSRMYEVIDRVDPYHPAMPVFGGPSAGSFKDCTDVFLFDGYPGPGGAHVVSQQMGWARAALPDRPIWFVAQAFHNPGQALPSEDDMRQYWQNAVAAGRGGSSGTATAAGAKSGIASASTRRTGRTWSGCCENWRSGRSRGGRRWAATCHDDDHPGGHTMRSALALFSLLTCLPLCAQSILTNGGFELGGKTSAVGWTTHIQRGAYEFLVAGEAHSGMRCLAIQAGPETKDGWARWYTVDLYLLKGATYHISAWVKAPDGALAQVNLPNDRDEVALYVKDAREWTHVEQEFTIQATGRHGLYLQSLGPGTVYFDDVSIEMVKAPPAEAGGEVPTDWGPITQIVLPEVTQPHHGYLAQELQRF